MVFANVMFSNCTVFDGLRHAETRKVNSYFDEFCNSLITISVKANIPSITFCCLGEVAKHISDIVKSSMPKITSKICRITWRNSLSILIEVDCQRIYRKLQMSEDFHILTHKLKVNCGEHNYAFTRKNQCWKIFSEQDLRLLGNPKSMAWLVDTIRNNYIRELNKHLINYSM